jgi:uncharacterized protein (TIGR03066 family)
MRTLRPLLALVLLLMLVGLASAQPKPQELIVGKWQPTDPATKDQVVLEFVKDGKVKVSFLGQKFDGSYKFTSDETMEFTLTVEGKTNTTKLKVAVTEKDLTLTPPDNKVEKYTRIK